MTSLCRRKLKGDVNFRKVHFLASGDVEMKLDEKVIAYFESCNSPVDKEGFLYKKGEIKTSYQKRWFVLKGNLLFYKDRPTERDLVGVIVLEGCTVQLCESEEQFAFSLVWSDTGLRTYKFAAEDQSSQESWIKALLSASHNYLALLVADMEKKYREALNEFPSQPAKAFFMPNFNRAEAGHPAASSGASTAGGSLSSNLAFQPLAVVPKRKVNAMEEWLEVCSSTKEDFGKLHEDFGKEVKQLIADWSKRGRADEAGGDNLIDFG